MGQRKGATEDSPALNNQLILLQLSSDSRASCKSSMRRRDFRYLASTPDGLSIGPLLRDNATLNSVTRARGT